MVVSDTLSLTPSPIHYQDIIKQFVFPSILYQMFSFFWDPIMKAGRRPKFSRQRPEKTKLIFKCLISIRQIYNIEKLSNFCLSSPSSFSYNLQTTTNSQVKTVYDKRNCGYCHKISYIETWIKKNQSRYYCQHSSYHTIL